MKAEVIKCLFCKKTVPQVGGKKKREFCDGNCRNKFYYRESRKGIDPKPIGRPKKKVIFVKASEVTTAQIDFRDETPIFITTNPKEVFDSNKKKIVGDELGKTQTYKPKQFDELLKEAKAGVNDVDLFKKEVRASKCTPNQKEMILSKLPK